ncbi:MAG TPA: hypothetical protein VF064_02160, partial [Pyrinomonadaceae bacterium]
SDDEITREDYIGIVQRIEREFLKGVQRNIRTRVLAEWVTNLKMIFSASYSRTLRVGELYESELFARVPDGVKVEGPRWLPDWAAKLFGLRRDRRWLNDLYIHPLLPDGTQQTDFKPRSHNWRRASKSPDLILNAATLNTGHNWQFTASWMGEPPTPINADIDCNYRLRRMYYENAPEPYRQFRLGHAVAASSCVPGLFEPLILDGLYPYDADGKLNDKQRISVRLVDGGAVDNQGINSLLEQDCTVMLISDGSGQMDAQNVPDGGLLGPPLRTNSILQARIREAQYTDIASRRRSSLLRALMFIHLRQELTGENLAWKDCPSKYRESDFERADAGRNDSTSFGVAPAVQRQLSAIRTDLDSFSDAEAYALMASAYRMTAIQFTGDKRTVEGFAEPDTTPCWDFLKVEDAMRAESADGDMARRRHLERLLDVGSNIAFKIWMLSGALKAIGYALAVAAVVGLVVLFYRMWEQPFQPMVYAGAAYEWVRQYLPFLPALPALTFGFIGGVVISTLVVTAITIVVNYYLGKRRGKLVMKAFNWRRTLTDIGVGLVMATVGFAAARLHLHVFDKLFLRYGRLAKFPKS